MNRRSTISGFTLLELMVAVALTLIFVGIMLAVTIQVLELWRRTQGMHLQTAAARQVLDFVERDLSAAIHRNDSTCWLAVDILDRASDLANHGWLTTGTLMKPAGGGSLRPLPEADVDGNRRLRDARFGLSGGWLRFVTTNVESGGSLPTVVAYQVVRRPVTGDPVAGNAAPVRYSLYRSVVSAAETFSQGYNVTAIAYGSNNNTPSSALSTAYRSPRNVTNPSHANLLAPNVIDFGCWLYAKDSNGGLVRIYPGAEDDIVHHAIGQSTFAESRFPAVVDVLVRVLSEEGASVIEAMETGRLVRPAQYASDALWWWAVVEANSAVFFRRIEIKGMAP